MFLFLFFQVLRVKESVAGVQIKEYLMMLFVHVSLQVPIAE